MIGKGQSKIEDSVINFYKGVSINMKIKKLKKTAFAGKRFVVCYQTNGFYDILKTENGFCIQYVPFESIAERSFEDEFFSEWLDKPVAYGAFEDENLLGFVEGAKEAWNNRFRISNICVFDNATRHRGIGTALLNVILSEAEKTGARMVVLETQSCNENAIAFYRKNGFEIIGFDLYAYSNNDPECHEIRIEMGKKLEKN